MRTILEGIRHDLRVSVRRLRRSPGFAAVALAVLGLGIGTNAAIFGLADRAVFRPLPYTDAERLVDVSSRFLPSSGLDFPVFQISGPEYIDYRDGARTVSDVAAWRSGGANLSTGDGGAPDRVTVVAATPNLLDVLDVRPARGRGFRAGAAEPGAACEILIAHGLRADRFGGDPDVVGSTVRLDGEPCTIAGVMAADFTFPDSRAQIWRPLVLDTSAPTWGRMSHNLWGVGRLAPGVSLAGARSELESITARWAEDFPQYAEGHSLIVRPLTEALVGDLRARVILLMAAVGIVLLIACTNLASLAYARGESQRRSLALRAALGAGRGRLIRLAFTESVLLAAIGGAIGVLLSGWLRDGLLAFYPGELPGVEAAGIDGATLAFSAGLAIAAALVFGLVPAIRTGSPRLTEALGSGDRRATGAAGGVRSRRLLITGQVALGFVLSLGAGLLVRSYHELQTVELGFDPERVMTFSLALPPSSYPDADRIRAFYSGLLDQIREHPGVASAGAISSLPLDAGAGPADGFLIEGRPVPEAGESFPNAAFVMATPGTFSALRIPLRSGRLLDDRDHANASPVAVINESAARRYWPDSDPIGRRIRYPSPDPNAEEEWITIVGSVGDIRADRPEDPPRPAIYVPHAQMPRAPIYAGRYMSVVVRAHEGSDRLLPALHATVRRADPGLPLIRPASMSTLVRDALGQPRFTAFLMTGFAGTALFLAALGLYGVLAYWVVQRRRELGIRLALGARSGDVVRMIVRQGLGLAAAGLIVGVPAALALAQLLRGMLFTVTPLDVRTLVATLALMAGVAAFACWLPARRAARSDPALVLRHE